MIKTSIVLTQGKLAWNIRRAKAGVLACQQEIKCKKKKSRSIMHEIGIYLFYKQQSQAHVLRIVHVQLRHRRTRGHLLVATKAELWSSPSATKAESQFLLPSALTPLPPFTRNHDASNRQQLKKEGGA